AKSVRERTDGRFLKRQSDASTRLHETVARPCAAGATQFRRKARPSERRVSLLPTAGNSGSKFYCRNVCDSFIVALKWGERNIPPDHCLRFLPRRHRHLSAAVRVRGDRAPQPPTNPLQRHSPSECRLDTATAA